MRTLLRERIFLIDSCPPTFFIAIVSVRIKFLRTARNISKGPKTQKDHQKVEEIIENMIGILSLKFSLDNNVIGKGRMAFIVMEK